MNHHNHHSRHQSGCCDARPAWHGHQHGPMSGQGQGCGPARNQGQGCCSGPSHHPYPGHHPGHHGMPIARPHGFGMGRGAMHASMWAGARIEPDRAMLEAKLAYLVAWRDRLDSVIDELAARLDGADCCCGPVEHCECEEQPTADQAPCCDDASESAEEPR